ncbi:MAG: pentapeptide repeat-containing protein [Brevefilum sp.]|nr:pentapeptide repeat-containing protein [Brevefilum sp.]
MQNFSNTNIQDEYFSNLDFALQSIEKLMLTNCTFRGCHLTETILTACLIENCRFINCDLSLMKIPQTHFHETSFKDCRMLGINWCMADWEARSLITKKRVGFENCLLDHSIFSGLDLSETQFIKCKAHHLDFEGANLTKAVFRQSDLEGTLFLKCDLSEADFYGAVNYSIDASQNKLHKTRFSLPEAVSLLHALDILLEDAD